MAWWKPLAVTRTCTKQFSRSRFPWAQKSDLSSSKKERQQCTNQLTLARCNESPAVCCCLMLIVVVDTGSQAMQHHQQTKGDNKSMRCSSRRLWCVVVPMPAKTCKDPKDTDARCRRASFFGLCGCGARPTRKRKTTTLVESIDDRAVRIGSTRESLCTSLGRRMIRVVSYVGLWYNYY